MSHNSSPVVTPKPGEPFVMGIDVCKERLDIALCNGQSLESVNFDSAGLRKLMKMVDQYAVRLVVVESTGGIERPLLDTLLDAGKNVSLVQPGRVRYFAQADAKFAKTDKIDAVILARFGSLMAPRLLEKRSQKQADLDALVTCRRQLLEVRTEQTNRRRLVTNKAAIKSMDAVMRTINSQVETLDKKIRDIIDDDDTFSEIDRVLQTVPGVGPVVSSNVLANFNELGKMDRTETAALLGVAPFNRDSGDRRGKRSIRGGRMDVRNAFYMAATSAMIHNPVIRVFADRLAAKGKDYKVIATACMRKLAILLNAMLRDNLTWDELEVVKNFKTV